MIRWLRKSQKSRQNYGINVGVEIEFNNVQEWAADNTMILNLIKTKELIFYNPKARFCHSNLPLLLNLERVTSAKLLGVYIQSNYSCDIHFNHIMTVSSQRLHILKVLKRQGLSLEMLHNVFYAIGIIVNREGLLSIQVQSGGVFYLALSSCRIRRFCCLIN